MLCWSININNVIVQDKLIHQRRSTWTLTVWILHILLHPSPDKVYLLNPSMSRFTTIAFAD